MLGAGVWVKLVDAGTSGQTDPNSLPFPDLTSRPGFVAEFRAGGTRAPIASRDVDTLRFALMLVVFRMQPIAPPGRFEPIISPESIRR